MQSPRRLASSSKCRRSCRATPARRAASRTPIPASRAILPVARDVSEAAKAIGISCEAAMAKVGALRANESGERTRIHCERAGDIALESVSKEPCLIVQGDVMRGNDFDRHR